MSDKTNRPNRPKRESIWTIAAGWANVYFSVFSTLNIMNTARVIWHETTQSSHAGWSPLTDAILDGVGRGLPGNVGLTIAITDIGRVAMVLGGLLEAVDKQQAREAASGSGGRSRDRSGGGKQRPLARVERAPLGGRRQRRAVRRAAAGHILPLGERALALRRRSDANAAMIKPAGGQARLVSRGRIIMFGHPYDCTSRKFPLDCRYCGQRVVYWECRHGSKVFFDPPGRGRASV